MALAAAHPDDTALYCDVLLNINPEGLIPALMADVPRALKIVRAMPELLGTHRSTERAKSTPSSCGCSPSHTTPLTQPSCAWWRNAVTARSPGWLWDQWTPQDKIRPWLRTLTGDVRLPPAPVRRLQAERRPYRRPSGRHAGGPGAGAW